VARNLVGGKVLGSPLRSLSERPAGFLSHRLYWKERQAVAGVPEGELIGGEAQNANNPDAARTASCRSERSPGESDRGSKFLVVGML